MKLKLNRVNGENLSVTLKRMLLMDPSIYLNIDNSTLSSNVYSPEKDIVKTNETPIEEVFEFSTDIDKPIRIAFFEGSKVLNAINYFDKASLRGTIHYVEHYNEDEDFYIAEKLTLQDNTLKIDLHCADYELGFVTMTEAQLETVFSDSEKSFEFDLTKETLATVIKLFKLDTSELVDIVKDQEGIHIKGSTYDSIVDDSYTSENSHKVTAHKKFFEKLDKESYTVKVVDGRQRKVLLNSQDSKTNICFNLAMGV